MTSNGPTEHISIALIVDDDLGFVWWFGEIFFRAGYQVVPALSCREALSRVKELDLRVDLVLVNPKLRGVSRMLRLLKRTNRKIRKVFIRYDRGGHRPPGKSGRDLPVGT
jgi:DNA-binding NtrC family response regulator